MALLKNQIFTLTLVAACVMAFLLPEPGATGGLLKSEITVKISVALVFFLQGLNIRSRQILHSATRLRVLLFCQSWNYALAPAIMILLMLVASSWIHPGLRGGLLYLSVLPTTISSAIVLTGSYRGDAATSLFNATLSNLLGVVITPIWCIALFSEASNHFPPIGSLILKIAILVILPITIAQVIRPYLRDRIEAWKPSIRNSSNAMIVFIVYVSFSNSVVNGLWETLSWTSIATAFGFVCLFLLLVSSLVWTSSAIADNQKEQRIAAFFCGSQKTLATGAPMASIIFANQSAADQGLVLLPLILYHSLQILLASIVGPRLAK